MSELRDADGGASQALLAAALSGLLCLTGCSGGEDEVDPQGAETCNIKPDPNPQITKTETGVEMSEEEFRAKCDQAGGTVEVHPHCGGVNSCRGFSYDSDVDTYTEHTCRGANTCTGFSCVICED